MSHRESPQAVDAVDPRAADTGKPTTRASSSCSSCAALEAKLHEQQEEIERLRGEGLALRREIAQLEYADEAAESSLATLRARIGELEQEWMEQAQVHRVAAEKSSPTDSVWQERWQERLRTTEWMFRHCADQLAALLASSGVPSEKVEP